MRGGAAPITARFDCNGRRPRLSRSTSVPTSRLIEVACGSIVIFVYRRSASRDNSRGTGGLLEQTFEFVTLDSVDVHEVVAHT